MQPTTACLIVIGNEILSGRTQDKNIAWLGKELNEIGIRLTEVRIIADDKPTIIATVNECRTRYQYVFTTGGIGPTHDDITSDSIAAAFKVPLERNKDAKLLLEKHYPPTDLNEARLKMADIPVGAELILNPVSVAPGFRIENVYVMAGVPRIMNAMFDGIRGSLKGGAKMLSRTLSAYVTEGTLAEQLTRIQQQFPEVEIGSYPFIRNQRLGTSLVIRSTNTDMLEQAYNATQTMLLSLTQEVEEE